MIRLLFVADGERDEKTVPKLVERIAGLPVSAGFTPWSRLHDRGYSRKLRFAVRQARDARQDGLVATVDADRDRKGTRLRDLKDGRDADRAQTPAFPTVLGAADPHLEAWLLDDAQGVKEVLTIPATEALPRSRHPKNDLDALITDRRPGESHVDVLAEIASAFDPDRCPRAGETGLRAFVNDVRAEFRDLVALRA